MNYQNAIDYIHSTYKFGSKLGLENIKYLLELLGNPQDKLKTIHVAGTNGKGSTSSFIHNILKTEGYKVGLYTSPYIQEFTERIKINGENIPRDDLAKYTASVKKSIEKMVSQGKNHPTEFEIGTAIALLYFARQEVDYLILEVGLGGRLDATNIIKNPLVSVITIIGHDHVEYLGDSLDKIAFEKAGIIKKDSHVVSYPQDKEAMKVIKNVCMQNNSELTIVDFTKLQLEYSEIEGQKFTVRILGKLYKDLEISLAGEYQIYNCCTALTVIEILKRHHGVRISDRSIYDGLYSTSWMGRFEVISRNPLTIIDGAHNLQGAQALRKSIESLLKDYEITFVVGMLADKDVEGVLKDLVPLMDKVIITEPNNPRAMKAHDLSKKMIGFAKEIHLSEDVGDAVKKAYKITPKDGLVLFAGSLYMIGEVRSIITKSGCTPAS